MKSLFVFICWVVLLIPSQAQNFDSYIKLVFVDAIGQRDTIILGSDFGNLGYSSTLGIDTLLGERDIYGTPYNSLDVRLIQRDSMNHECLKEDPFTTPSQDLYSPYNLDSKVDFRPFNGALNSSGAYFCNIEENFEIAIHADNYPLTIIFDSTYIGNLMSFHTLDTACVSNYTPIYYMMEYSLAGDTLTVLTDPSYTTMQVRFEILLTNEYLEQSTTTWTLYPNPVHTTLNIEGKDLNGQVEIINGIGEVIQQQQIIGSINALDISHLQAGIYFLHFYDNKANTHSVKKFVKGS